MTESQAQTKLLKLLREKGFFYKATDRFQAGIPDILGCYEGRFMAIEMKVDYNKPTPLQVYTIATLVKHKAYCAVVTYSNKGKQWWVRDKSFKTPREVAGYLLTGSRERNDEIQD